MGVTHLSKFRLATCPLTGGKKPGGSYPIRTTCFLMEKQETKMRVI